MLSVPALPSLCTALFSWRCPHLHPMFFSRPYPSPLCCPGPQHPAEGAGQAGTERGAAQGAAAAEQGAGILHPSPGADRRLHLQPGEDGLGHPWLWLGILPHLVLKTQDWRRNELLAQGPSLFSFQGTAGRVWCCLLELLKQTRNTRRVTGGREMLPISCRAGLGFL